MTRKMMKALTRALCGAGAMYFFLVSASAQEAGAPAMWKMTDENSTVYIFGTFHILPPDIRWETDIYRAAMIDAETTITEADTDSAEAQAAAAAAIQKYGFNPPGVTLSATLGEERAAGLGAVAARFGVPMQALEPYRPWLALLSLSLTALQKDGFDPDSGVERILLRQTAREGDSVDHFETAAAQIEILASLDDEEMLANFDATLEQFDNFRAYMGSLLEAWRTGDIAALDAEINGALRIEAPDAFEKLLVARNRNWVVSIKDIMAGDGDYFIAVGAGHLVGEDSVIDLLEEDGFKIDRIQ